MINSESFEKSKHFAYRSFKTNPYLYLHNVLFHFHAVKNTYNTPSLLKSKNTAWQIILLQETPQQ